MKLEHAQQIAQHVVDQLKPYCQRIQITGSIRRRKPEVKDIEVVCIPKTTVESQDMFGGDPRHVPVKGFIEAVHRWDKVKGDAYGKYTQRIVRLPADGIQAGLEGREIKLDLFKAVQDNWGLILAIRTGSADFSKGLGKRWVKQGIHGRGGMLYKRRRPIPIYEEKELFDLLGMPYVNPEHRF